MKSLRRYSREHRHGSAVVEFALMLPMLILLLVMPLYVGRILWHYAAIQAAAQNGARFLASAPLVLMKDPNQVGYVTRLTEDIVRAHLDQLNPGEFQPAVDINCNGMNIVCNGFTTPATVRVVVQVYIQDIFFPESQDMAITISAEANVAYLGK